MSITMRVYDYSHVDATTLAKAQEQVAQIYARVGVGVRWFETVKPLDRAMGREWFGSPDVTILLIDDRMAAQRRLPSRVLGSAAVDDEEMGRVAYVLRDRIVNVALRGATEEARVLSVVIAHEVGHLLLPRGSSTSSGLMRPHWEPSDFHRAAAQPRPFSAADALTIRQTLEGRRARVGLLTGN